MVTNSASMIGPAAGHVGTIRLLGNSSIDITNHIEV